MKQLESIGLVQYFLYNRQDIKLGRNTAFLGPNGTGKTALLDALQIVLLGGDRNRIHFNASSDGKRRARSMRDYCLGVHGQRPTDITRQSSNTYVYLVFRDESTGVAVTAGVALSASADNPDHTLHSMFILPGVALTTEMLMEREGGKDVILPWRRAQHVLNDVCRALGTTPTFTPNGSDFSRQLYTGHLNGRGDTPNWEMIRSTFARSLKLNREVDDLDETLREHLIEKRDINIDRFRQRLDQFRELRQTIRALKERLEEANLVDRNYKNVRTLHAKSATFAYLRSSFDVEQTQSLLNLAEKHKADNETNLKQAQAELDKAESDAAEANSRMVTARVALQNDPEYFSKLSSTKNLDSLRGQVDSAWKEVRAELRRAAECLSQITHNSDLQEIHEKATQLTDLVSQMVDGGREGAPPSQLSVATLATNIATLHKACDSIRFPLAQQLADSNRALEVAKQSVARANAGKAALRPEAATLQSALYEVGIKATPICDLIKIKDLSWQPAIEAFLSRHVDALMIHDVTKEKAAIDICRSPKLRVSGVKLALASRSRVWGARNEGQFAAELITGEDDAAVRYVQGVLDQLTLVETSEELRRGLRALSKDGMLASGGGVERLGMRDVAGLRIGARSNAEIARRAQDEAAHAAEALVDITRRVNIVNEIHHALSNFGGEEAMRTRLQSRCDLIENVGADILQTEQLQIASGSGLSALEDAVAEATADHKIKDAAKNAIYGRLGEIKEKISSAIRELDKLTNNLAHLKTIEVEKRIAALCDLDLAPTMRNELTNRFKGNLSQMITECASTAAESERLASSANTRAWSLMTNYLAKHQIETQEISDQNWQGASELILAEISRMSEMELVNKEEEAERAYTTAVDVFRSDVAHTILSGFDAIEEQIRGLNRVLDKAPEFTNGERFQFKAFKVPQHRKLYDFLQRIRTHGEHESDIFGGSGPIPDEFRELIEAGASGGDKGLERSPLRDHRIFYSYDVEISAGGEAKGMLSKRFGAGSGGEHRTPLYVIFAAALAAAFGKPPGQEGCGGFMMLDEAFEKMDAQNVRATAEYINALGLQMLIAGPETDQSKMSSFLDVYWDMARFGSNKIHLTRNEVNKAARDLLVSDIAAFHPELLEDALAEVTDENA